MSSQYPHDQGWGNRSNASPHAPNSPAQGAGGYPPPSATQGGWPQYSPQPEHMPVQQQTYLNNNIGAKPNFYPSQPASQWNRVQSQPPPNFQQPPGNPYYMQPTTSPIANPYANAYGPQQFVPQQTYQPPPQPAYTPVQQPTPTSHDECWNWGDESSSDSPATSTPNNNWGSQTPAAFPTSVSLQGYFQPTTPQTRQSSLPVGHDIDQLARNSSALTVENVSGVESRFPASKSESPHSYQSGSNASNSELKREQLSPDPNKIALTTQALREFHKEAYENGPGVQHRLGMETLTPQWSIESQLSQETVSDDVLSSQVDGSDADFAHDGRSQHLRRLDEGEELRFQQPPPPRVDDETAARFSTLSLSETENKEVITPEQQRALNVAGGGDRAFPQNGYSTRAELIDDNLSHAQGDGSANPPDDVAPPLGGFKPFDKKPNSPRPHASTRPADVFAPAQRTQHSPRPEPHSIGDFNRLEVGYPLQQRPAYSEDIYRPPPVDDSVRPVVGYGLPPRPANDASANLETIPDNKERPDLETRRLPPVPSQHSAWYGPDNQEITTRGDRNQYLETGQLADQDVSVTESANETDIGESLPPPGLSRLVTGAGHNIDMPSDTLTPPPGLDREVLGRLTDAENQPAPIVAHATPTRSGLQRMVMGQPTDEPTGFPRMVPGESSSPENQAQSPPPPTEATRQRSYPRMVPGESSSPEIQVQPSPAGDARVVPGVARDDSPITTLSIPTSPGGHRSSLNDSPDTQTRSQPQAERSETIGSDHVETFTTNPPDNCPKPSKRRNKERRRDDGSSDERDSGRRHDRERDYYRGRERDVPSSRDRHSVDWDRRRERSPHRYHDDRDRRRASPDRYRDETRRRKHMKYSDDDDEDYSDRERSMSGYRDDYDRSYSKRDERARSHRPEKSGRDRNDDRRDERDKRRAYDRDADRDREREHRSYDYYRRRGHDEPDDYHEPRSRPSSRNDSSVHDFKGRGLSSRGNIDRDSERDHYRGSSKRDRDPYYSQAQAYNYNPMYYAMYQQYYEQLRRVNPAAYADLCRKYQASSQQGAYSEDRGSVHSGRSSANDDSKDRTKDCGGVPPMHLVNPYYLAIPTHVSPVPVVQTGRSLDVSSLVLEEPQQSARLTPTKYSTAHVKGILTTRGQLIKIAANYPLDGQPATIEIHETLLCSQTMRDQLQNFPGPLIKGVTHKNNVVRYCQQKIKDADLNPDLVDKDSYKLIWELLILLLRQNGTIVGTDIAELLMNQRSAQPPAPSPATSHHSINEIPGQQNLQEEEVTNKFRDLLIYGNTKEALEWAMKHSLWGHALFLSSKMDNRTYARVMTRFANGLPMNDPLQTLYQLMSGRQPAVVTCCMDERWGDWRPHLAMILSNQQTEQSEVGLKAIVTLGDSLGARGSLYAAHFCYLIAQQHFGDYSHKSSKIVLIGSPHNLPFHLFATNEAIFATEIFEFACNLAHPDFVLHHLQVYKLIIARRLAEVGMTQEAVHYVEVIANTIMRDPSRYPPSFIREVYNLGDMLKFSDPVYTSSENDGADLEWLKQLLPVLADYQSGLLQHNATYGGSQSNLTTYSDGPDCQASLPLDVPDQSWQQQDQIYSQPLQNQRFQLPPMQPNLQKEPPATVDSYGVHSLQDASNYGGSSTDTPSYWTPPPASQWSQPEMQLAPSPITPSEQSSPQLPQPDYFDASRSEAPPSITLPGASSTRARTTSQSSDGQRGRQGKGNEPPRSASQQQQQTPGWFGGLWTKLSLRPKNQMHLPDDTNPSIIYDADKKRWVDQNADDDDGAGTLAPPPMAATRASIQAPAPAPVPVTAPGKLPATIPNANPLDKPLPPSGPNMYKMPRGRSLRGNYIDVMNPGDKMQKPPAVPTPDLFPSLSYPNQHAKLFVPPPVEGQEGGMNLFTPTPSDPVEHRDSSQHQGLSRWSSTSSLSREVQKYTSKYTTRTRSQVSGGHADPVGSMVPGRWNANGALAATLPRAKHYN